MQVRGDFDDAIMADLMDATKEKTGTGVTKQALKVLKWAIEENRKGRQILSTNADGQDVHRLIIPGVVD